MTLLPAFTKGSYVRVTKIRGRDGATLQDGERFEGTLHLDVNVNGLIYIDSPGTHYLITTRIVSIEGDLVHTSNSTYLIEEVPNFIDRINAETARKRAFHD